MSIINEKDLKIYEENSNFIKYENKKALFKTKIASSIRHNDEIVDVIGVIKGRDEVHDAYIVRFNDDTIENNIMNIELQFDYIRDKAQEKTRRILSKVMKKYDLSDKEAEEVLNATYNYDYEANDGTVFTTRESIENLFRDKNSEEKINPTNSQLKAMAEYIKETKEYYMLYGYEDYTKKIVNSILNNKDKKEFDFEFCTEDEIKEIIKFKTELYYVDDGVSEAIIKFEDIPDFIIDYNRNIEMRDLKFFRVGKGVYEPDITTYGEFLNTINPDLRERMIDRLVALQTNEVQPKKYKIINEDLYTEVKKNMDQEYSEFKKQKKNRNMEVR